MRLFLIRHAQAACNAQHLIDSRPPGSPLTELGQAQAEALAVRLGDQPIEAVWASDLVRAAQTAAPLARTLGLVPRLDPGLREIAAGDYEGADDIASWSGYATAVARWAQDPTARLPGGETGLEFFARYNAAMAQVAASGLANVAVVSHGAAIGVWLTAVLGETLPVSKEQVGLMANTAHVVLILADGRWRAERWTEDYLRLAGPPAAGTAV
ncbi:MAG: histidine phosphatase family protein [Propionibacteriaceae bacterium]|jgi:probable phosphoglycerate mutase|nr:histidine phosphatase family protein [Propionibacteriaceae bacterium]